jgi:hypothetical protein
VKVPKNFKIDPAHDVTQPSFPTSTNPKPTPRVKPQVTSEEDRLPPSIYLSPKDVLTNRKPARRIPPGSYSDRIKALQARRKNIKLRGNGNLNRDLSTEASEGLRNNSEEDEMFALEGSANEQIQNKREIGRQRHKTAESPKLGTNNVEIPESEVKPNFPIENSTEVNSDEAMSIVGITKSMEESQLDAPRLMSLQDDSNEAGSPGGHISSSQSRPTINPSNTYSTSLFNTDLKPSSKSPFNLFTMSTEEPSLPLEAYFPILSSHQ